MRDLRRKTDRVIVVGFIKYQDHSRSHQQDFIQSADGICRAIPAGTHASTPHLLKTLVYEKYKKNNI